jgi:hypothetical protein
MIPVTAENHSFIKATGTFTKKPTGDGVGLIVAKQKESKRLNWISRWLVVERDDSIPRSLTVTL